MSARGKLIVFEGLDRAGKTTQVAHLVVRLQEQGHLVRHLRFPDRTTPIGQMISAYLTGASEQEDHVIHLLFSANRWELAKSIRASIEAGETVIIDRYYYSGIVYSAAKDRPNLSLDWARHPEVGLPRPDAVVFLSVSPEAAARRSGFGTERYEESSMQQRVRQLYAELRKGPDGEDFTEVDAGASLEEVAQRVWEVILAAFKKVDDEHTPLRTVQPL